MSVSRRMGSLAAVGVPVPAVPLRISGSPCLKALTSTTEVFASGLNAAFMLSSHVSSAAGAGAAPESSLLPQPETNAVAEPAATASKSNPYRTLV